MEGEERGWGHAGAPEEGSMEGRRRASALPVPRDRRQGRGRGVERGCSEDRRGRPLAFPPQRGPVGYNHSSRQATDSLQRWELTSMKPRA